MHVWVKQRFWEDRGLNLIYAVDDSASEWFMLSTDTNRDVLI